MSINAMAWAKTQVTGSPAAKLLLLVLCDYANQKGVCFAKQETLASVTEQSVDTIQRRLRDLEKAGLIYRPPQSRLKGGRNAGAFTSGEIIVLADSYCLKIAREYGYDPENSARESAGVENQAVESPSEPQTAAQSEAAVNENNDLDCGERSAGAADCGAAGNEHRTAELCGSSGTALLRHRTVTLEQYSPLNPPKPSSSPDPDDRSLASDWDRLKALYPTASDEALDRARNRFRELPPEDRAVALKAAANYVQAKRAQKQPPMSLRNFLHPDNFREWETKTCAEKVFVRKDSDAWRAWCGHLGRTPPVIRKLIDRKPAEGWFFDTLFPPAGARAAG
ncbi:hypothetical protein M2322_000831 [Rhodoblastus acidophilus]|uniref:helix-turn-helix domain-containing protein n=1 Tax=Rhodoblastus acidophilus TaxID=1074 RepID=UPI0022248C19|nr:helix-turn-helix domain-containing protein [Rhodoblastus acidophilus]MCW2315297.1 hypothetical protein [Rhodoblastus acidophilus]